MCGVCAPICVGSQRTTPAVILKEPSALCLEAGSPLAQGLPIDVSLAGRRALGILLSQLFLRFSF